MAKRMTDGEYLENWEEWRLHDWYAVEEKDAATGEEQVLYVTPIRADAVLFTSRKATGYGLVDYLGEPCEPGEFGDCPYYRMVLVKADEAKEYLEGGQDA